jgi:hypothetical protein
MKNFSASSLQLLDKFGHFPAKNYFFVLVQVLLHHGGREALRRGPGEAKGTLL